MNRQAIALPATEGVRNCTHCGELCPDSTTIADEHEHAFCCFGCRTVYQILSEHRLTAFYELDAAAGRSQRRQGGNDYSWLDVDKLTERLTDYRDETVWRLTLELPAIHCASCVWLLENLHRLDTGVRSCTVNFGRRRAVLLFDPRQTGLRQIAELLSRIGYPPHFTSEKRETAAATDRQLLYRIGAAGFIFGNTMLLSFPEYFGLDTEAGSVLLGRTVSYLLLALSLPVLLYSGRGFLTAAWRALRSGHISIDLPIALGMLTLFGQSAYAILTDTGPGYLDSLSGLVFFLLVGRWFQTLTFDRLSFDRDHTDYFPVAAYRYGPQNEIHPVATEDLLPGDAILVRPGDLIPADGVLTEDCPAGIDYSFVSGEAEPQARPAGAVVYAGGRATTRALRITVTKATAESYLLQLWRDQRGRSAEAGISLPEHFSRWFTLAVVGLAIATLIYWLIVHPATAPRAAAAVLIIACPCALALAAPFAYGTLLRVFARAGCYLRGAAVITRLPELDTFVFDKTGTLVSGRPADESAAVTPADGPERAVFLAMARQSSHPASRRFAALLDGSGAAGIGTVEEVIGGGLRLRHNGHDYRIGSPAFCGLPSGAAAGTHACRDNESVYHLPATVQHLRRGAADILRELGRRGEVFLLSGDQPPGSPVWEVYLPAHRVLFRQSPFAKKQFVEERLAAGRRVLMVGDGLNDAGALEAAAVGLAVSDDVARFSPACDGILLGNRLHFLPWVLRSARRLRGVLRTAYSLALIYNLIGLSFAVRGALSPIIAAILMPVSSITIVVVCVVGTWLVSRRHPDYKEEEFGRAPG
ncbi:MAG: heavy metal translocating P-type ATPase metal-binding domain-containing protein [Saprospiraceae bacterium]